MLDTVLSYMPYALITTFTPGPNNLMSLYSVSTYGWRKGSRVIWGIFAGFTAVMAMVILSCSGLAQYMPGVVGWLKYFGAAYILWLAWHIAVSAVSWCMWGTAGGLLQRFLVRYYRPFNVVMGLALLWCAVKIAM